MNALFVFLTLLASSLLHGASCRISPRSVVQSALGKIDGHAMVKRQTAEQIQCVSRNLDATFAGNTSNFVSRCKTVAVEEVELEDIISDQTLVNELFQVFCIRDCGNAILKAYDDCGVVLVGGPEFFIDLCGTNSRRESCYEFYVSNVDRIGTETTCNSQYQQSGTCSSTCRSQLDNIAEDRGCCINAYHDFYARVSNLNLRALYVRCDVDVVGGCNNSPVTYSGSVPLVFDVGLMLVTLGFYLILG